MLSYFSTYSPPELRHLSYHETNLCIPVLLNSATWDWNQFVTFISACYSENADADWTGISWGVRKLDHNYQCWLHELCFLFRCQVLWTHLMHYFLSNRCSVTILCNKEWEMTSGTVNNEFQSALCSVHSKTWSQTTLRNWQELE